MRILKLLCPFFFLPFIVQSQLTDEQVLNLVKSGSEQQLVTENSRMTQEGYLYHAEMLANKLLTIKPESSNYNYRKGYLMLESRNEYENALPYFEKAVKNVDANYDMYGVGEKSAPTDAYFHLATCYHLNENIEDAKTNYHKFLATTKSTSELIPITKLRLIQCEQALQLMATPVNVYLKNIGSSVNSQYADYAPVISLDGSSLYFTSKRPWEDGTTEPFRDPAINQYPEDVYVSYMDSDSSWMEPVRLEFCAPQNNEATIAVSSDERRIYLYEDSTGAGDIYFTDFYSKKFNDIKIVVDTAINTEYWETHCMVSPDGSSMYIVSDRPGGFGGRDIYKSKRKNDGTWSNPINLGARINTAYDEDAPFVSVDNKKLYFSSNGEKSIGGFDILVSDLLEDGNWSESNNIGYPFNSPNDDIFYTTTIDGLRGYMTSYRKDGHGEKDIYEIHNDFLGVNNIAVFKGKIKTTDGSELPEDFAINVKLTCDDCEEYEKNKTIYPRLRDGLFMTGLKPCKTYKITYFNATDNFAMFEESFTTKCDEAYQEIFRALILDVPTRTILVPKDTIIEIDTVDIIAYKNLEYLHYFDYNKNKLSTSKGELKDFLKLVEGQLKEGRKRITINVYSSASHVPTKTYESNEKLTQIRAENMKYDLQTYFESNPEFKDCVTIAIISAIVDGPDYVKDGRNKKKYKPYQFVGLKTE